MPYLKYDNIRIASLVTAVPAHRQCIDIPEELAANDRLTKTYVKQIGVQSRHISITEQTCVDIGYAAARKALEMSSLTAADLDGIIFATQSPDFNSGTGNAFLMHYRLGMREDTLAFDIALGCSSFPFSLSTCASLLQQPDMRRILLIIGDTAWPTYPTLDELLADNRFLFGEGTSAIILEKTPAPVEEITVSLFTDGAGYKYLYHPFVGYRNFWRRSLRAKNSDGVEFAQRSIRNNYGVDILHAGSLYMDGLEVTAFSTTRVVNSIKAFAEKTGKRPDEYDALVLHQANKQIVRTITKRLGLTEEQVPMSLDRYANVAGAGLTLTISDTFHDDPRDKLHLLTSAFGIGLSWGIANITIEPAVISPILLVEDDRFEEGYLQAIP
ncbi:MAG: hypothetical protein IKU14_07110 [Rhodocyclaceae bacterium]|nr:hypothetical protein [Rhodocyclaceae bacterium]